MTNQNPVRHPSGVPTGGQFAVTARPETAMTLPGVPGGAIPRVSREALVEAWGDGPAPTPDEERLLEALTDPGDHWRCGFSTEEDEILENLEFWGSNGDLSGPHNIAQVLAERYRQVAPDDEAGTLSLDYEHSESGPESYQVSAYLGIDAGGDYLMISEDIKYLNADRGTSEGASGLRKAVYIAGVIDDDHARLLTKLQKFGIDVPSRPTTAAGSVSA